MKCKTLDCRWILEGHCTADDVEIDSDGGCLAYEARPSLQELEMKLLVSQQTIRYLNDHLANVESNYKLLEASFNDNAEECTRLRDRLQAVTCSCISMEQLMYRHLKTLDTRMNGIEKENKFFMSELSDIYVGINKQGATE